jgi:mono/diheme cytochrome c family protein
MCPDPLEQRGLTLRLGPEHRRISSQHRQLDALHGSVAAALAAGSLPDARSALLRFRGAWDAHTSLEDGFYFPALRGLRPALAPSLAALSDEHLRFRGALDEIERLLAGDHLAASAAALDALVADIASHEQREEAFAQELGARGPEKPAILRAAIFALAVGLAGLFAGSACSREAEPAAPAGTTAAAPAAAAAPTTAPSADAAAAARSEAAQVFATRCTTCHGERGAGDGPASAGLTPPPRNFQDAAWQASVTDAHIEQIVQYGGSAVGKSAAMPANPDLNAKPEVVAALREYVRDLAR